MALNLGTGHGISILEVVKTLENILGYAINIEWLDAREGDPPALVADASKAMSILKWEPKYSILEQILRTALNWFESQKRKSK
jgi:UDP-glucose 4-epimerase